MKMHNLYGPPYRVVDDLSEEIVDQFYSFNEAKQRAIELHSYKESGHFSVYRISCVCGVGKVDDPDAEDAA